MIHGSGQVTHDTIILSDGRSLTIETTPANEVTVTGDVTRLAPRDAGMLALGIEHAATIAGQRAARLRMRDLAAPRRTIEQVAAAVERGTIARPPEPADAALHAGTCNYRRNWACDCGAGR